jgi:hypothetical protein
MILSHAVGKEKTMATNFVDTTNNPEDARKILDFALLIRKLMDAV